MLGEENVFDLLEIGGPEKGLIKHKDNPNLRIIVCGGDGTVHWIIQDLIQLKWLPIPPVISICFFLLVNEVFSFFYPKDWNNSIRHRK